MRKNKKHTKILTLTIAFLLLSTIFTASVNSEGILPRVASKIKEKINDIKDNLQTKDTIKKETNNLKETIEKIKERSHKLFEKNNKLGLISTFFNILKFKKASSASSIFTLYTNYAGNEKTTPIRLGLPTSVDIDNDGDNDIKASFRMYPFIEKPLVLTLNFNLKITRLPGFEDPNEFFETYLEFHFLGILNVNNTGDKVKFGYQSKKGFKVPDTCQVTYKYLPYLFYLDPPKHKLSFNPGIISDKEPLALVFGYDNAENTTSGTPKYTSKSKWTIHLDPVIKTELTFGGSDDYVGRQLLFESSSSSTATIFYQRFANNSEFNAGLTVDKISTFSFEMEVTPFKKGGGRIEYIRNNSEPIDASLFFKKDNSIYFYIKDIPQHVKLSWTPETDGIIELNTFGERVSEVGIRDTLPSNPFYNFKAFLKNLPSLAQVKWNWELFNGGEINIFCEQTGCSAHIIAHNLLQTGTEITGDFYTNDNIDMSIFWDFSNKSFGIKRTSSDITMDLQITGPNGTSLDFSTSIKNTINGPFQIKLGELFDGNAEITFTSNILELYDLTARLNIPSIGSFVVKASEMIFNKAQSGVEFRFSTQQEEDVFTLNVEVEVFNGIIIRGLMLGYNDFLYPVKDINNTGHQIHKFSITATRVDVDFWISEDGSRGYVYISGGLIITFDSTFERPMGNVIGFVYGSVCFDTTDGYLNISWDTIDGQTQLDIDASGVASLSGFKLWVKDKININIPSIVGEFTLSTRDKTGEVKLYLDSGTAALVTDFNIKIVDLMNVSLNADISLNFDLGLSGFVGFAWSNGNLEYITGGGVVEYTGTARINNLYFKYDGEDDKDESNYIELSAKKILINGYFNTEIEISFSENTISDFLLNYTSGTGTYVEILELSVDGITAPDPSGQRGTLSAQMIYGGISGELFLNLSNKYIEFSGEAELDVRQLKFDGSLGDSKNTKIELTVELLGGGDLIVDLNKSYVDFDVYGDISLSATTNLENLHHIAFAADIISAKGTIKFNSGTYTEITISSDKDLYITDFMLNYNMIITFTTLFLRLVSGEDAVITLSSSGIQLNAAITAFHLENLRIQYMKRSITFQGGFSFGLLGALLINFDSTSDTPKLHIWLPSGIVTIYNVRFSYIDDKGNLKIAGKWDDLELIGGVELIMKDDIISAAGKGRFIFDGLNLYVNLSNSVVMQIDYFKLDMDDVKGSVIKLHFEKEGEKWTIKGIQYATGSAVISRLEIRGLHVNISHIQIIDIENERLHMYELEITDFIADFKGSGQLYAELGKPDKNGSRDIYIYGSISGPGYISIDYFFIHYDWTIIIELDDFILNGPTTFHLDGNGKINLANPSLNDVEIIAGCTSTWSSKVLNIYYLLGFDNLEGKGDISLGIQSSGTSLNGGDLIVHANGNWKWDNLRIYPYYGWNDTTNTTEKDPGRPVGPGDFDGNLELRLDLGTFLIIFGKSIPHDGRVEITAYGQSIIHQWGRRSFRCVLNIYEIAFPYAGKFSFTYHQNLSPYPDLYLDDLGEEGFFRNIINNPGELGYGITSTCPQLSISGLQFLPGWQLSFWVAGLTMESGSTNLFMEWENKSHVHVNIQGSGTLNTNLDGLQIKNAMTGEVLLSLVDAVLFGPYFDFSYDIDLLSLAPDLQGYIALDTNNMPIGFSLRVFDTVQILRLQIRAEDLVLAWNITGLNIFKWFVKQGSFSRESGDILIKLRDKWYSLWGTSVNTMEVSITDYSGTGTPTNMNEGDKFKVKVEDALTNQPISGALAQYQYKGPLGLLWRNYGEPLTTGSDGKTDYFTAVKIGEATNYRIKVTASGYDDGYVEFTIGTAGYGVLSGKVTSYYGPISGATVSAAGISTTTDSQGMYSLTLPVGTHLVTASKPGYESETQEATIVGGQQSTLNFYLYFENAAFFRGYVYDGSQQDAVLINATVTASGTPGTFTTKTRPIAPLGWYELEVIGDYYYKLTVSYPGYQTQSLNNQFIQPGESKRIDFILYPQGQSSIGGKVIDNYGYPLKSATVKIGSITLTTGSNGNYYAQVTPGTYTITVSKNKFITQTATVTVSSGQSVTKDFQLIPEYGPYGYIVGKVKDKSTGRGIAGVKVSTTGPNGGTTYDYTDSNGNYRLYVKSGDNNIDGGHYGYYINADGRNVGYSLGHTHLSWVVGDRDNIAPDIYLDKMGASWVSPTGHNDPDNDWRFESRAHDNNVYTWAASKARYGSTTEWTGFLELTISSIKCDAIKFNAFYNSKYVNKIDIDVYCVGYSASHDLYESGSKSSGWHHLYEGSYSDHTWITKYLGGTYVVTKARVRFYLKGCLTGTTAQLYEFAFRKVP